MKSFSRQTKPSAGSITRYSPAAQNVFRKSRPRITWDAARQLGNATLQLDIPGAGIQAMLKISSPDDEYEREADAVADQVMRMPDSAVQRST